MAKTSVLKPAARSAGPKPERPLAWPERLLAWYDKHARDLPWREHQGRAPSPYHTWISEVMLQQTGVVTVIPYYQRFIAKWPNVAALAKAPQEAVLKEWAGLGYYSRARNLQACAKAVTADYGGVFPSDIDALKKLPGIGNYTANAIRAIAFDLPANVVDGNVERVMARVFGYDKPINDPKNKKEIHAIAARVAPRKRPGDYAQALMDLGATICTPKKPKCGLCPWRKNCVALATERTETLPVSRKKKAVPTRYADAFLLIDKKGRIYLRQRPEKGLLGGLWEIPGTAWRTGKPWSKKEIEALPFYAALDAQTVKKTVTHVFSHFKLITRLHVSRRDKTARQIDANGGWFAADALPAMATLTEKMLRAAKELGEISKVA